MFNASQFVRNVMNFDSSKNRFDMDLNLTSKYYKIFVVFKKIFYNEEYEAEKHAIAEKIVSYLDDNKAEVINSCKGDIDAFNKVVDKVRVIVCDKLVKSENAELSSRLDELRLKASEPPPQAPPITQEEAFQPSTSRSKIPLMKPDPIHPKEVLQPAPSGPSAEQLLKELKEALDSYQTVESQKEPSSFEGAYSKLIVEQKLVQFEKRLTGALEKPEYVSIRAELEGLMKQSKSKRDGLEMHKENAQVLSLARLKYQVREFKELLQKIQKGLAQSHSSQEFKSYLHDLDILPKDALNLEKKLSQTLSDIGELSKEFEKDSLLKDHSDALILQLKKYNQYLHDTPSIMANVKLYLAPPKETPISGTKDQSPFQE